MNNLKLAIALLAVSIGGNAYSQDLLSKVPAESKFVVALNGKGFFKHANVNQLNEIFKRTGLFEKLSNDNEAFNSEKIEEFGIDLNSKSYIHFNVNDSIQYIGALIPLKDKSQFESVLPVDKKVEVVNGLNTIYSDDKTLRVSWDQQTIYVLGGLPMDNYFSREDVKEKYGLLSNPEYDWAEEAATVAVPDTTSLDWDEYDFEEEEAADTVVQMESNEEVMAEVASVEEITQAAIEATEAAKESEEVTEIETEVFNIPPPALPDDFESVDSVLEQEEYQDDYYTRYSSVTAHNDSIKDIFVSHSIDIEMERIISGKLNPYKSKNLVSMKDNELVRMEMGKFDSLIQYYYPTDIIYGYMGRPAFDYGYEALSSSIVVEGNRMKIVGDISFDKEMTKYYKEIYRKKLNPRFYNYLSDDALGFVSFNVNTEAYLKHMPAIVKRVYGGMDNKVGQIIDMFSTAFDVIVDEKAVAKVFKGDNLFVLNGVTQKEVKYIDYEYDDDYNATEVEKTKMEKIPNYIWMFSSDDTRIFEKIFKILESEDNLVNHDGIYEIKSGKIDELAPYILIDKGIVFLGNDLEQLQQIKSNSFNGKSGSRYASVVKKNKFSILFNTKKIPGLIDDLDLPVHRSMEAEVKNLAQYGDLYIISNGMKGNKFNWEAGVDFPNTSSNAIDFIINTFDNISKSLED